MLSINHIKQKLNLVKVILLIHVGYQQLVLTC